MKKTKHWVRAAAVMAVVGDASASVAQGKIGVTLSTTRPAASLGIPENNTIVLLPKEIDGRSERYIVLDEASDTRCAARLAR